MSFCVKCGKRIPDGAGFCPFCGTPAIHTETNQAAGNTGQIIYENTGFHGVRRHDDFSQAPPDTRTVMIEMCPLKRVLLKGNQRVTINFNGQTVWDGYVNNTACLDVAGRCEISVHYHMHANFYPGQMSCTIDPAVSTHYQVIPRQSAFHLKLSLQPVYR